MNNSEKVIAFLKTKSSAGSTNADIASGTGIRPHQQVFQITQRLLADGIIKGRKIGSGWEFWLDGEPKSPVSARKRPATRTKTQPTDEAAITPTQFEVIARAKMSEFLGTRLIEAALPGIHKRFDFVSEDGLCVGDAKFYKMVKGSSLPPAKFSVIAEHVWLLEKTHASTKFLVFGNDARVPQEWLKRYGNLVNSVSFFFLDSANELTRLN